MKEQEVMPVAFQGERGAYSEMAVRTFFPVCEPVPCKHFADVFQQIRSGLVRFGAVPVENALTGSIHENFDLLLQYADIKIVGEVKIRIQHCLIGNPEARIQDIQRVYSHPQGLLQCEAYLDRYPGWERYPYYDTAGSVAYIMAEGRIEHGAIASSLAADIYGAQILAREIETNTHNYTRFFVLALQDAPQPENPDKASIVFSTRDKPGALLEAMQALAQRNVNLQKIESRPIHGKPWTYMFYLDLDLPRQKDLLESALDDLAHHSEDLRVLGRYTRAR